MKTFLRKLAWLATRRRKEIELREELEFHLAAETDERQASGLSEEQARSAARRDLGNVTVVEEDTRAAWGWSLLEQIGQDLRYGVRTLSRAPGIAIAADFTLALGIGATTTIFSVVNTVLLQPLPYEDSERLVRIALQPQDEGADVVLLSDRTWRELFGEDPRALGRVVTVDGRAHTVVGVMPPTFEFPMSETAFWVQYPFRQNPKDRSSASSAVLAQLADGVSLEAATTELNVRAHALRGSNADASGAALPRCSTPCREGRPGDRASLRVTDREHPRRSARLAAKANC